MKQNLRIALAAAVCIWATQAVGGASCSAEDGSSTCACQTGERCVRTQSQCWCEPARYKDDSFILGEPTLSFSPTGIGQLGDAVSFSLETHEPAVGYTTAHQP